MKIGIRDQFMMILLYDTGARIQELLDIRICDIKLGQSPQVILHGKGNKIRTVPLMKDTVAHLNNYMSAFHNDESWASTQLLFYIVRNGNKNPVCDDTGSGCKNMLMLPDSNARRRSLLVFTRIFGGTQERCTSTNTA